MMNGMEVLWDAEKERKYTTRVDADWKIDDIGIDIISWICNATSDIYI